MNEENRTVLIVDDDAIVRDSFVYHFEDSRWRVLSAGSAEEALDVLTRENPDGAVVDIRLPGIDGDEFIRCACKLKPKLAYVICTGSPKYEISDQVADLAQVCEQVFLKPVFNLDILEESLCRQIDKLSAIGSGEN